MPRLALTEQNARLDELVARSTSLSACSASFASAPRCQPRLRVGAASSPRLAGQLCLRPMGLPNIASVVGDALSELAASAGRLVSRRRDDDCQQEHEASHAAPATTPAPTDPKPVDTTRQLAPWLQGLVEGHARAGVDGALAAFDAHLAACSADEAAKPSNFIMASEVLHECGAESVVCADVLFNVLETKLPDTQVCRVVAYHLLTYGAFDDALRLLELVRETLAPAEPHSYTDLAFARFHRLRAAHAPTADRVRAEMASVVADLAKVVVSTEWAARFREIEWPVLILLSWAVAWAEHTLTTLGAAAEGASLWPEEQLPAATYRLGGKAGPQLDVFVWLGWDTDHTDVDLHVKEPTGEEVYYSHNSSSTTGAHVSRDFTDGYGPEVYTLPKAPAGEYKVETNYFSSHQASSATGSTSAVVWSIQDMGCFETELVQFSSVRLTGHKQRQQVLSIVCDQAAQAA